MQFKFTYNFNLVINKFNFNKFNPKIKMQNQIIMFVIMFLGGTVPFLFVCK